jgi:hypothetical protein
MEVSDVFDYYYGLDGKPISQAEWSAMINDPKVKFVAHDEIRDTSGEIALRVSTVWLGIDHNHSGLSPKPLIFESMVFRGTTYEDIDMMRYATLKEARIGHGELVAKYLYNPGRA